MTPENRRQEEARTRLVLRKVQNDICQYLRAAYDEEGGPLPNRLVELLQQLDRRN
jgi:hypothetical protein